MARPAALRQRAQQLCLAVTAACVSLSPLPAAASTGWVLNTNQNIDLVNLGSNLGGTVSSTFFPSESLAVSPAGTLYAADPAGNLWNVTAGPIPVGPTGRTQIGDLDWAAGGLWGYSNATGELFFFDLGTSTVTSTVTLTLPVALPATAVITGVAHQPGSGDVFLSARDGLNNDSLLRVPAASSTALLVGGMAHGDSFSHVSDIDFDASGTLVAMTWFHRWFYGVSTTTAATNLISIGPHRDSTGLALLPVPEPATTWLLGMGLAVLALRRVTGRQGPGAALP